MNDPNGPIFHRGRWHLFYQHLDIKHWGHAVSEDLINWEIWPIAMSPNALGEVWSGSVVYDAKNTSGRFPRSDGGLIAIFTFRTPESQSQGLAFSDDDGKAWTLDPQNPVLVDHTAPDFRDPKVFWHATTARWILILAAGAELRLYASLTLKSWHLLSTIGQGILPPDVICECPDLFELAPGDMSGSPVWILNVSIIKDNSATGGSREHRTYHLCGNFDGTAFTPIGSLQQTSYGPDDYACMTFGGTGARRVWVGWMSNWSYADRVTFGNTRGGPMTLPRELSLLKNGGEWKLIQRPTSAIFDLFKKTTSLDTVIIPEGVQRQEGIHDISASVIDFNLEPGSASRSGIRLDGCLEIGYDTVTNEVYLRRQHSQLTQGWPEYSGTWAARVLPFNHQVKMQVILDHGCVELFVNDGAAYFAALIFPVAFCRGLDVFSEGGTAKLKQMVIRTPEHLRY